MQLLALDLHAHDDRLLQRLDPRAKVLATLLVALGAAMLPARAWPVALILSAPPILALLAAGVSARRIGRAWAGCLPLLGALALARGLGEGRAGALVAFGAGSAALLAAIALVAATPMPAILTGLRGIGLPEPLDLQLGLLHRYLFALRRAAGDIAAARALRDGGRARLGARLRGLGAMLGVFLADSLDRADAIGEAMVLRGFEGRLPSAEPRRLTAADLALVAIAALAPAAALASLLTYGWLSP